MLMEINISTVENKEKQLGMEREEIRSSGNAGRRESLNRLRLEMDGQVCIPDTWGQENRLQDWANCTAFTAAYMPPGLSSARDALTEESRQSISLIQFDNRF